MAPEFFDAGQPVQHPLEQLFNAKGWDILSAIEKGFRAQVDVKGKLAELFLHRHLERLLAAGMITALGWRDQDGVPDFSLTYQGIGVRVECKNIRSPATKKQGVASKRRRTPAASPAWKVEMQKTRNQIAGGPKRGYKADEFEILAVCLFNQTRRWEYLFIRTADLLRRPMHPDYLAIMQTVPPSAQGSWKASIEEALQGMVGP